MRLLGSLLLTLLSVSPGHATDGEDCFSRHRQHNVCDKAKDLQREFAETLPLKLNSEVLLAGVVAVGPKVVFLATWLGTRSDFAERLSASGLSDRDFERRIAVSTRNSVCGQGEFSAFVRRGGRVQHIYRTSDGVVVSSPEVLAC
jgi:hypothetical protein